MGELPCGDPSVDGGPGQDPCQPQPTQGRPSLTIGPILVQTIRHFFPNFNDWLDEVPDPRDPDPIVYHKRFLLGWGLTRRCGETTLSMHQVLEAKLVGPGGMVLSLGSEFFDQRDADHLPAAASEEQRKQDCELKALRRLAKELRG